jgi:hypothetical protein
MDGVGDVLLGDDGAEIREAPIEQLRRDVDIGQVEGDDIGLAWQADANFDVVFFDGASDFLQGFGRG